MEHRLINGNPRFFALSCMSLVCMVLSTFAVSPVYAKVQKLKSPREFALQKLREAKVSSQLIKILHSGEQLEETNRVVELNVLGFLGKADYSVHYSTSAVEKCREFLNQHREILEETEKKYRVPKEILVALLWVETKLGHQIGTLPVTAVYFSLLQADHREIRKTTLKAFEIKAPHAGKDQRQKAIDRSYAKAKWALGEIKSLDLMLRKGHVEITKIRGSYAGAFGIPQFIPSSYLQWAKSSGEKGPPNLFDLHDAVESVANYLRSNGWKTGDVQAQKDAIYHYNRADGYVAVIQKIAAKMVEK